jgi:HlyD family secretion protein
MAEKRTNGWLKWIIISIIVVLLAAAGFWAFARNRTDVPDYQTTPVTRADLIQAVTATGTLNPVVNVTVGSQVSGIITKLYVDYNSLVKSNEIIAEIDPSTYQAAVEQAKANLANARANLELQDVQLLRNAKLYTNNLISGSDYDTAVATRDEAAAQVQIQQASLTNAVANLGYCKIRSPVDGIVITRAIDLGQTVASSFNTPTLFQIANDLTKMQIDTSVAEADVGGVKEGQDVDFTVDAYPYRDFHGVITQVRNSPTTVNNVVTYDCVIGVTNADYKLKPGMTANVSIIIAKRDNVLTIPNGALRFRLPDNAIVDTNALTQAATNAPGPGAQAHHGTTHPHGDRPVFHTVYVLSTIGKDVQLRAVPVKTGISDGISTEVVSGLNEGDQVVTGATTTSSTAGSSSPFGFPRMR